MGGVYVLLESWMLEYRVILQGGADEFEHRKLSVDRGDAKNGRKGKGLHLS